MEHPKTDRTSVQPQSAMLDRTTFVLPASASKTGIFLCTPVAPEFLERSKVLGDLSNTKGTATLPDGINDADITSWMSLDPKRVLNVDFADLCKALQVPTPHARKAHAMSDQC